MSLYGKLGGALISAALIGGAVSYIASAGSEVISQAAALEQQLSCYLIKKSEGTICVYKDGDSTPIMSFELPADSFSAADDKLLTEGIRIKSFDELTRLIEDLELQ